MFWLFLNSACTAPRLSLFPTLCPYRVGWGRARSWEGTQEGTADLKWPEGCSIPYGVMLSSENWGRTQRRGGCLPRPLSLGDWRGFGLLVGGGEHLPLHCLASSLFSSPIKLFLSEPTSFLTFVLPILSPTSLGRGGEWASRSVGAWLLPGVNPR